MIVGKKKFNVFVDIPVAVKVLIFLYWLVYTLFLQTYYMFNNDGVTIENVGFVILSSINVLLLYLPILAFKNVGILHPLTLPTILSLVKGRMQDPISFLSDFYSSRSIYDISSRIHDRESTIVANFEYVSLNILAYIILYVSFYSVKKLNKQYNFAHKIDKTRLLIMVGVAFAFFLAFFVSQGGIRAYIDSWGEEGGRQAVVSESGLGVFISFLRTLYFIPVFWYLATPGNTAFKSPIFIVTGIIFMFSGFLGSGSRSSVFAVLITMVCIWVLKNRKIPTTSLFVLSFVSLILFGMLGQLRTSVTSNKANADWSVLDLSKASESIEYSLRENSKRDAENPHIAMFTQVPEKVDFLYGKSFASVLTAYIPRSVWEDKPHSGAYYSGRYLFGVSWSIPIGGVAEVYWNFGYLGIFVLYFFWGSLLGYVALFYAKYHSAPGVATLYVIILLGTGQISSLLIAGLLQKLALVIAGLKYMKSI